MAVVAGERRRKQKEGDEGSGIPKMEGETLYSLSANKPFQYVNLAWQQMTCSNPIHSPVFEL